MPEMAGFCKLALGLQTPNVAASRKKSPMVSDGYLECSRFCEKAAGDPVRSALRAGFAVRYASSAELEPGQVS